MAVNREELISCLNDLIETCRDGEKGFRAAAERVKDAGLKQLFSQCSLQRTQFASELQAEVRQLGGTLGEGRNVSTDFYRGWTNIKFAVAGGSDDAIIAECERGEDTAVGNYQRILKQNLPPNVLPVAKHQYAEVKRSHDHFRDMSKKPSQSISYGGKVTMSAGERFLHVLAGAGIGAAIGILFAPKSGVELRSDLSRTMSGKVDDITAKVDNLGHKVFDSEFGHQAATTLRNVVEKGKNVASIGRERFNRTVEAGKQRLDESIEAGRSEYDRTKNRDIASR